MALKSSKAKKAKPEKNPELCEWLVHNMDKSVKNDFIALAKMKNFKSVGEALKVVLNEWNKNETGKQLWKRMETVQGKT